MAILFDEHLCMNGKTIIKKNFKLHFAKNVRANANVGQHDAEYCRKQDESRSVDAKVEESILTFMPFD